MLGALGGVSIVAGLTSNLSLPLWIEAALMVPTAVVAGAFSSWCASARTRWLVTWRALGGGAFTAACLTGVYLPLLMWIQTGRPSLPEAIGVWFFVMLGSLIFVAPVGAAISLFFLPMLIPAWRARRGSSYDAANHVRVRGGLWLAGLGLAIAAIARFGFWERQRGWEAAHPPLESLLVGLITAIVGVLVATYARFAARRRRQWLAAVRAGDVPEYRIVPLAELPVASPVDRFEHGQNECDGALVRVAASVSHSYREAAVDPVDEPLALVRRAQ